MASHGDDIRGHVTCAVEVSPDTVDAGAELALRVDVSCSPPCDLRGHALLIKDGNGGDAGSVEIVEFDGEVNSTDEFFLEAPAAPGAHTWSVVCPAVERGGTAYHEASAPLSFTVTRHATHIVAWDIPPDIVVGERFRMKVGIKCSAGCDLANSDFEIYDHEGNEVAAGTLSNQRWPETVGLYGAEVELEAPASEGLYTWIIKHPTSSHVMPHAEGAIDFGVRVVAQPECLVTIQAVDMVTLTPLGGARVVMHPYRVVADEDGVARVRVAKGAYRLFVSHTNYLTVALAIDVSTDVTSRVELELEPVLERN